MIIDVTNPMVDRLRSYVWICFYRCLLLVFGVTLKTAMVVVWMITRLIRWNIGMQYVGIYSLNGKWKVYMYYFPVNTRRNSWAKVVIDWKMLMQIRKSIGRMGTIAYRSIMNNLKVGKKLMISQLTASRWTLVLHKTHSYDLRYQENQSTQMVLGKVFSLKIQ